MLFRSLERTLEQNLTLKLVKEDSLIHRASVQAIQSKKTTLEGLNTTRELYLRQFKNLTGFEWEGVSDIPEPNLLFNPDQSQSSTLKLKSLAVDLAKEDLAIQKATYTNKSLVVGGSVGGSASKTKSKNILTGVEKIDYYNDATIKGSASLIANQYKISGSVSATYDFEDNTFTPSLTIGGSWSNNPSSYSEGLKLQQLENAVLTAELAYRTAIDEFNQSVMTIQNSIASYVMNYSLLLESDRKSVV